LYAKLALNSQNLAKNICMGFLKKDERERIQEIEREIEQRPKNL
jgi:hypothetical protein